MQRNTLDLFKLIRFEYLNITGNLNEPRTGNDVYEDVNYQGALACRDLGPTEIVGTNEEQRNCM